MSTDRNLARGRTLALVSVVISAALAALNVAIGLRAQSASVVAIGVEFAGDVLASAVVLAGLVVASRPPDANHPYGHGRIETVAGLLVGFVLVTGGIGVIWRAMASLGSGTAVPGWPAILVLIVAIVVRGAMAMRKFRVARQIGSSALQSDAWNDSVDILSAFVALGAVLVTRVWPEAFADADHYGAAVVGVVVVMTGIRVVRSATLDLADTMPDPAMTGAVRRVALSVPGVEDVEKQRARKTGLQYHVDLHIEVDPDMTVRHSHRIAHEVQDAILAALPWVAAVLVHIEPAGGAERDRSVSAGRLADGGDGRDEIGGVDRL